MYELCTLGTIDLRSSDGSPVAGPVRHAKRIGLLAYLAAPHPVRLHRRETLVALLLLGGMFHYFLPSGIIKTKYIYCLYELYTIF